MEKNNYINKSLYRAFVTGYEMNPNDACMIYMNKIFTYKYMLKQIEKTSIMLNKFGIKCGEIITVALPNMPQTEQIIYGANKMGIVVYLVHPMSSVEQISKFMKMTNSHRLFILDSRAVEFGNFSKDDEMNVFTVCPIAEVSKIKTYFYNKKIKAIDRFLNYDKLLLKIDDSIIVEEVSKNLKDTSILFNGSGTNGISNTIELSDFALNSVCGYGLKMGGLSSARGKMMSSFLPFFHPFGFTICMHMPNCFGFCITAVIKFNMDELMRYIKKGRINYLVGVPTVFSGLMSRNDFSGKALKKLEASFVGGDFVPNSLIDSYNALMKEANSINRLYQAYGPSETSAATCLNTPVNNKNYTCGKPIDCVKYRIYDEETNELKEVGQGELYIAGDSLFNGYYNSKENTDECTYFDKNGERYLKSGDIMKIDSEGYVTFVSRKKRIIKVSGFTIFPSEIEQIAMQVNGIKKVCALGVPDEKKGSKIILFFETDKEKEMVKSELLEYLNKYLEPKAIPSEIIFLKKIPVTPITKIDTITLRKMYDSNELNN